MRNEKVQRFVAEIIDNDDVDQEGRVKIYVESFMSGWESDHYPWARAGNECLTGGSNSFGGSHIPEIGSLVWVWFEKNSLKKNAYYESDLHLKQLNPHTLFENKIKSSISSQASYPNAKFTYYKNGLCIGVDSSDSNPELFIKHPSGTYIIIDKDGKTTIEVIGDMDLKADNFNFDGDVSITGKVDAEGEVTAKANSPLSVGLTSHITETAVPGPAVSPKSGT